MIKPAVYSGKDQLLRLLTLALVLSLLALGWLSWTTFRSYLFVVGQLPAITRMEELRGQILLFDEVLTMSARMAAATDDSQWEARYRRFEPQLDRALKEVMRLTPQAAASQVTVQTDLANARLVVLENRAFELVRQGRRAEAQQLLASIEYEAQKEIYAAGMTEFNRLLKQTMDSVRAQRQAQVLWSAIATAVLIPLLVLGWWLVFRAARRWQTALAQSNEQLNRQTAELQEFTQRLDAKVAERTKQLQESALATLNMMEDAVHNREQAEQALEDLKSEAAERQRAENTLRESEDRYRSLVEESPDAIGIYQEGKLVFINATGARQLGAKSKEELLGRKSEQFIHPDDFPASSDRLRRRLAGETGAYPAEVRYRRLDGTILPVEVIATPITFGGKAAMQFIARDITERKQAEQHLRDSAALYHSLVENLAQHVFRKDLAGRFTFGNNLFCQSLGKPLAEILDKTDLDLLPAPLAAKYRQDDQRVVQTGQTFEGEEEHRQANGNTISVHVVKTPLRDATGQIIGVQGIAWDITEKKQLEAQLRRTQRLESIGTLASGVAHDLNNALAPILMSIEMMRLEFPETASRYLDLIQGSAKRGADMVKQLLTFAKGAEGERVLVQPKHLFKEMQKLITSTFPKNIELRTHYAKNLQTILGDATQLHQVLLNLCVNARDAMPEGGTLTLEAENVELDAAYARAFPEAKPGHYAVWRVTDTGTGIPQEILDRIFEPFFSTKGPDKGTGLGLSTALAIVRGHGGFVRVYSNPGQGSTFAVHLPTGGSGAVDTSRLTKTGTTFRGHGEFILVVDDEAAVRDITRAVLTALNFQVLTAANGTAALIQVAERRTELRAVITDLHMPGMDGLFFVRVLKARLPQAGSIVASGRMDERELDEFKKLGVHAVLEKPFTQEKLVKALKTIFMKQLSETSPPSGEPISRP